MDAFFLQSGIGGPGGLLSQHIAILDHFLSINTKSNIMFYLFILIISSNKVTFSIMI